MSRNELNRGLCAYNLSNMGLLDRGTCSFGCWEEPSCHVDTPEEGWPVVTELRDNGGAGRIIEAGPEARALAVQLLTEGDGWQGTADQLEATVRSFGPEDEVAS